MIDDIGDPETVRENQQLDMGQEGQQIVYCNWHPDVATELSCGKCSKSTCIRCLMHVSAGIRCPDCSKATKTFAEAETIGDYLNVAAGAMINVGGSVAYNLGTFGTGFFIANSNL